MNMNYYDYNSSESCKIKGTISLEKTQVPTNLILFVYFDSSTENINSLTAEWLLMMTSIKIESF